MSYSDNPYNNNPYHNGMGDFWQDAANAVAGVFGRQSSNPGSDGEYAIPGVIPGNTSSSSSYVYISAGGRTVAVNTPPGYSMWPEVVKQQWQATQRSILAGQGGAASGADVRSVQAALNRLPTSLPRLSVDGAYGARTRARVVEFQQLNGQPATGVLDALTVQSILAAAGGATPNANSNVPSIFNPYTPATPAPNGGMPSWLLYAALGLIVVFVMD